MPEIAVVYGSKSDEGVMQGAVDILKEFGIEFESAVLSAHRQPEETAEFAKTAAGKGIKIIIAGAGLAAALPGVIASHTILPVIGVPVGGGPLNGLDALLSTVQMPPGVPVGTVSIGSAGGVNAAVLACRILALSDEALRARLIEHTRKMAESVEKKDAAVQGKRAQGT